MPTRVLIAGLSTRAAGQSAARAGFLVSAIDAFGDLDQDPAVHNLSLGAGFTPHAAARAGRAVECDAVVYLSNFENHPRALQALAAERALWGNTPEVLTAVRNPVIMTAALRRHGFSAPSVCVSAAANQPEPASSRRWLVKPRLSGGGHGVRLWDGTSPLSDRDYLQEFSEGVPGSLVFVAAAGRAVPVALSRQLIGEGAFGSAGYRYCGSILTNVSDPQFPEESAVLNRGSAVAEFIAREFGLVGLNGIDFVARDGVPYLVEVNPRWSASVELAERAWGLPAFAVHAAACAAGELPSFDLTSARSRSGAYGKAIIFARRDVTIGNTRAWLALGDIGDVPRPRERILAGRPVCTVFATGQNGDACHAALVGRAERVYAELDVWERVEGRATKGTDA